MLVATLQAEWHLTPEFTLVAMGHYERPSFFDEVWRAAGALRAYPFESLAIDLGVGFDRIGQARLVGDVAEPFFSVEWRLPLGLVDWQFALFVERNVSTLGLAGLRVSYGLGPTPRDAARHASWRRIR